MNKEEILKELKEDFVKSFQRTCDFLAQNEYKRIEISSKLMSKIKNKLFKKRIRMIEDLNFFSGELKGLNEAYAWLLCKIDQVKDKQQEILFFHQREKLKEKYNEWLNLQNSLLNEGESICDCAFNVITFLAGEKLLDIDKVLKFLEEQKNE